MSANLTYYIFEGVLTGFVYDRVLHIAALSGGAGGGTKSNTTSAANNPYAEGLKTTGTPGTKGHVHGGPIPPGRYMIKKPGNRPHLGLCAELVHQYRRPAGRDGFYIHGSGPHGSDGCIVPLDKHQFTALMKALIASGGGTLVVAESMEGAAFA